MNRMFTRGFLPTLLMLLFGILSAKGQDTTPYVAAFVWPSCHDEPRSREALWPEGIGEWEVIQKGTPRFEGHYQPKVPLWGYEMDNDPKVMEKWIRAAKTHGVNTFIFDWYWFDEKPFLESCLNDGFLKAANNREMNFYIMWANHDVKKNYWNVYRCPDDESLLWEGKTDWKNFKVIVKRIIEQYFKQPNYLKIDGEPIFCIYNINNLIETFGSVEETKKGLDYLREEARKAGFPGVHIQMITYGVPTPELDKQATLWEVDSYTQYNWGGPHPEDYIHWGTNAMARLEKWDNYKVPYCPNVSIGWDNTPRFPKVGKEDVIHYNNSPQSFANFLLKAKEYLESHPNQPQIITIFAWNEWIEGAYLLPDMKDGFGYLEAIKKVMVDGKKHNHSYNIK